MIDIVYDREHHNVSASGHAESAEFGKDLICASVSTLLQVLAINCCNLAEETNKKGLVIELRPGNALISLPATDNDIVRYTFDTFCCGFEFLANEFPEYITYKVINSGIETE